MNSPFFMSGTRTRGAAVTIASLVLVGSAVVRAAEYFSYESMNEQLACLAKREPNLVRLRPLARSREGRDIWIVELGTGTEEERSVQPAMLVVAGIEGNDLVGPFTAVSWIEQLIGQYGKGEPAAGPIETTTVYIIPYLNPDAGAGFLARPQKETCVDGTPYDEDHDGLTDEDGCEDLNGDGLITMMRVEDREEGQYVPDPNESRLLLKADSTEGEAGQWRLLPEGIDNDGDKRWNEDGPGGVNLNRNFPYGYEYFAPDAGIHMVSEAETRALADFVVAHPNIGVAATYGAADNLRKTPEGAESPGRSKPMEAIDEEDTGYYRQLGRLYRTTLGLDKELESISEPGTFSDWMYFHRGRLSLAVRPWDVPLARALSRPQEDEPSASGDANPNDPGTSATDATPAEEEEEEEKERNEDERRQLTWFDEHTPDAFIPWEPVEHPDFPGRRVEVGGYRPFSLRNPPEEMLANIAAKQGEFLSKLLLRLPRIEIGRIECHVLGNSIYEIEVYVMNTGYLPTMLAHGETTREVHPTRVTLELEPGCFLAGSRTTYLPTIPGSGGTAKARYTVRAPNRRRITVTVASMLAGQAKGTIELLNTGDSGAQPVPSGERELP